MRIIPVLLAALCFSCPGFAAAPASAATSDAPPQMRGLLSTDGERLFSLVSPGSVAPKWVKLGATFDGWELADFKSAEEALTLKKGTRTVVIKMEGSSIGAAAGTTGKATLAQAEEVLHKMDFERMMGKIMDQQKAAMADMTRQMGQGAAGGANREEVAAFQKKTMDALFEAMNFGQMKNDMAQVYSETFTPDELKGLSDFYSTPSGLAMIEKQPEVSQKV
ncbi:MAG: DUF2059 domain-containing protein [Opitutaceae bacterium]